MIKGFSVQEHVCFPCFQFNFEILVIHLFSLDRQYMYNVCNTCYNWDSDPIPKLFFQSINVNWQTNRTMLFLYEYFSSIGRRNAEGLSQWLSYLCCQCQRSITSRPWYLTVKLMCNCTVLNWLKYNPTVREKYCIAQNTI